MSAATAQDIDLAVPGVRVGHWSDHEARTGCTVVLLPEGTVASGEVRGGAPASRETALLDPVRTVAKVDAVVLSGGSAFGLATCDGVMRWCEERGIGYPTLGGLVPIVVGLCIYDLAVGTGAVRPGPDEGYAACVAARTTSRSGAVGVGVGATVDKVLGVDRRRDGGLGIATMRADEVVVTALVAVNAFGRPGAGRDDDPSREVVLREPFGSTTIGVVTTNATLDKVGCLLVAQSAHDGLSRAVRPAHTGADGDAFVAAAVGTVAADREKVRALAAVAVEDAVLAAAS
jgi:L-aminopeptidase/D-esterase-like protein